MGTKEPDVGNASPGPDGPGRLQTLNESPMAPRKALAAALMTPRGPEPMTPAVSHIAVMVGTMNVRPLTRRPWLMPPVSQRMKVPTPCA